MTDSIDGYSSKNVTRADVQISPRRGLLLVGLGGIFFGFTGVTSKTLYAQSNITPLGVSWLRMSIAAVALLLVLLIRSARLPGPRSLQEFTIMIGLGVSVAGFQVTFFSGVERSTVTTVTLIAICVAPVIVALFAPLLLGERLTRVTVLALICAVSGTVLLVQSGGRVSLSSDYLIGNLLGLGAAFSYGGFMLISKRALEWLGPLMVVAVAFCIASVLLTPVALSDVLSAGLTLAELPYVLWLGLVATALAYVLLISGLPYASATAASIAALLEPLTAAVLAAIFFGEELGPAGLVGTVLLLAGMIILYQRGS